MQFDTKASDKLVCAVLAAQVSELRGRIDIGATVELLWQTSDVLSLLSGLVLEFSKRCSDSDSNLYEECKAAIAAEAKINRSLESLAFAQAQRNDFTCQTVDCVVTALERMAVVDMSSDARLSLNDLAALYVSEEQREVHNNAVRQFSFAAGRNGARGSSREESAG
ncbi:hypothetical protein [Rhodopseudomonas sp. P2A-2r]|uniref:hypothetical protein n=1 Tax=unclassified Rhodopseudomonas TaxID=2638247 RepID=UPI0022341A68|nr:hypothetical protein [Rhodopseudomonas sp. P2A-2r]UZE49012.1 hypothetical protein ONR75_30565 [Rhodopseudomonas sp. P2A-2r]